MRRLDLAAMLRRFYALVVACMLPAGALLLSANKQAWAGGLWFGTVIASLNAAVLVRRITRAAAGRPEQAHRTMQQGMGIRFAVVMLATVLAMKVDPASLPGFLLGLIVTMALAMCLAARALFQDVRRSEGAVAPAPSTSSAPAALPTVQRSAAP